MAVERGYMWQWRLKSKVIQGKENAFWVLIRTSQSPYKACECLHVKQDSSVANETPQCDTSDIHCITTCIINILVQLTSHPAKISMPVFLHRCGYVKFIRKLMLLTVNLCCITVFNCWQLLPYTQEFLLGCPRIYSCTWNVSVTIGHKWSTISTAWLSWGQPLMVYAYVVQICTCTSCKLSTMVWL